MESASVLHGGASSIAVEFILRYYYRRNGYCQAIFMTKRPDSSRTPVVHGYAQCFLQLKHELQNVEYFCKGTVLETRMKCGQPACACQADPSKRHGPYWEWTYKAKGKPVNVRLTPEAGPIFK